MKIAASHLRVPVHRLVCNYRSDDGPSVNTAASGSRLSAQFLYHAQQRLFVFFLFSWARSAYSVHPLVSRLLSATLFHPLFSSNISVSILRHIEAPDVILDTMVVLCDTGVILDALDKKIDLCTWV